MCKFSPESLAKLATCHPDLQMIMNEAIKYVDFAPMDTGPVLSTVKLPT